MNEETILPYIEPIFRFCCKRLSSRYDAEDLSGEIICYILDGMKKYKIESLDAWVWRIAHNRYARFLDNRAKARALLTDDEILYNIADNSIDDRDIDKASTEQEFQTVFRYLHTLSSEYRNIFIDYYLGGMSVRMLSKKYALPETTVKWRLNVGRRKIRERIGENHMDKVYRRINWNTTCCNGNVTTDRYLHTQIARAICQAAYEKPLSVEEISISTGIPAMYIEDELPRLEYGDAICKIGSKYAANFIVFRLQDRKDTEDISAPLVAEIADRFEALLQDKAAPVNGLGFYGHDFGLERLGYICIPYILRRRINCLKNHRLELENGPYPPRKDGGYGWFCVEETIDENENTAEYNTGCNAAGDDSGSRYEIPSHIYYYWIAKYFDADVYHNRGTRWLCASGIPQNSIDGIVESSALSDEDAASLIRANLLAKTDSGCRLNFACFTEAQFEEFVSLFEFEDTHLDDLLARWIAAVRKNFAKFVPARLEDQINQWVSTYLFQLVGYVTDELIRRGALRKPDAHKPLTDGVFFVAGKYIEP